MSVRIDGQSYDKKCIGEEKLRMFFNISDSKAIYRV